MKFVKITVDGVTYTLTESGNGIWTVTNRAPLSEGDYLVTVTLTTEQGRDIVIDSTDESLLRALTLLVRDGTTESGSRMLNYYPQVIKQILEFQALMYAEGFEIDFLKSDIQLIANNAYLNTMDESRIAEWEEVFELPYKADYSIEDRRDRIIAEFRGNDKLNTAAIESIVSTFTKGSTTSFIKDGVLYVQILPPGENKQYRFENVESALKKRVPAHLGLVVTRHYSTWGEVKDNFTSWETVASMENWDELKLYIAP